MKVVFNLNSRFQNGFKMRFLIFSLITALMVPLCRINADAASSYDSSKMSFEEYVIANLMNFENTIDALPYAKEFGYDTGAVSSEVLRIAKSNPDLFHVVVSGSSLFRTKSTFTKSRSTGEITSYTSFPVSCTYSMTKSEYKKKKAEFDKAAANALALVEPDMTDYQKALVLHDYLALSVSYDIKAKNASSGDKGTKYAYASTAEGAFLNKSAVCEGYSMAYMYLLNEIGIENAIARSDKIDHAWNYVKLGSKWYHIDVTRDDPLFNGKRDQLGFVSHDFFLINDAELLSIDKDLSSKKDWDVYGLPASTSKTYTKAFWRGVETSIQYAKGNWYWIEIDKTSPAYNKNYEKLRNTADFNNLFYKMYHDLIRYNPETKKKTKIYKIDATWFRNGSENKSSKSWWEGSYSRIAIYDDRIYFNTAKEIKSVDLNGKNEKTAAKPSLGGKYIYGMRIIGNKLQYTLKTDPVNADSLKSKNL